MKYYKLKDIPDYVGYNVEYVNRNQSPNFTVEITMVREQECRVTLKNIVLADKVNGGTVSYKLNSDTKWILNGENTSFIVNTSGLYDIKFTDKARECHNCTKINTVTTKSKCNIKNI